MPAPPPPAPNAKQDKKGDEQKKIGDEEMKRK